MEKEKLKIDKHSIKQKANHSRIKEVPLHSIKKIEVSIPEKINLNGKTFNLTSLIIEDYISQLFIAKSSGGEKSYIRRVKPKFATSSYLRKLESSKRLKGNIVASMEIRQEKEDIFIIYNLGEWVLLKDFIDDLKSRPKFSLEQICRFISNLCQNVEYINNYDFNSSCLNLNNIVVQSRGSDQSRILFFPSISECRTADFLRASYDSLIFLPQEVLRMQDDSRADVYAVGMILYLLFSTGYPIENEENDKEFIIEEIVKGNIHHFLLNMPNLSSALRRGLDKQFRRLEEIIQGATNPDPQKRPNINIIQSFFDTFRHQLDPYKLAFHLHEIGEHKEALSILENEFKNNNKSAELYYLAGLINNYGLDLHGQAIKYFLEILKYDRYHFGAIYEKGKVFEIIGDEYAYHNEFNESNLHYKKAISDFKNALQINPTFQDLYFEISRIFIKIKNNAEAVRYLDELLNKNMYKYEALIEKATVLLDEKKLEEGKHAAQKAVLIIEELLEHKNITPVQANMTLSIIHNLFGMIAIEKNDADTATKEFETALKYNVNSIQALNKLGATYMSKNMPEKALHYLIRSLKIDPNQRTISNEIIRLAIKYKLMDTKSVIDLENM